MLAVVASLAVHLPVWGVLGELSKWFQEKADDAQAAAPEDVEISFVVDTPEEPEDEFEASDVNAAPDFIAPEVEQTRRRRVPRPEQDEEEEEEEAEEERAELALVQPPPADAMNRQAVQQRSSDPTVEAPEDARYLAEENNRVEEETVARITSYSQDAPEVEAGEPLEESNVEEEGNADEELVAEHREMEGAEERFATEDEANMERPEEASDEPLPNVTARGSAEQRAGDGGDEPAAEAAQAAQTANAGGVRYETVEISDGNGTFRIRRPIPAGEGGGASGGEARQAQRGRDRQEGAGARGRSGRGRGQGSNGPDLRVSWNQFENIVGREVLEEERERYVRERLSKQRGRGAERQRRWADFRAAIENYVSDVRPGNQTALNAAASPFANYIAAIHRRFHRQFAGRFIGNLPGGAGNPFNDQSLRTKLEIVFNGDGSIHRVGVVRTSGLLPFDYGAYNAVMSGQPYPAPPESIKSGNGKVYLHWSFHRNHRQCGTFNAEPYILPNPPGSPTRERRGPFDDREGPAWGGLVPDGASPTWGTEAERESNEGEAEGEDETPPESESAEDGAGDRRREDEQR
ncbi:MAG: hypothetical protein AAGE52_11590 [Myxococcota bacterium]